MKVARSGSLGIRLGMNRALAVAKSAISEGRFSLMVLDLGDVFTYAHILSVFGFVEHLYMERVSGNVQGLFDHLENENNYYW